MLELHARRFSSLPDRRIAEQIVAGWRVELEERRAGLRVFDAWKTELAPLVEDFVAAKRCSDETRRKKRFRVERALKELRLVRAADLDDVERIDVLWLKGRSIVRAFEVEHTTAIYSGILRMADLLALQPNMDIKLHIVAPEERKQKVFDEIRRPVFAYLESGPLEDRCSYISYDSVRELAEQPHLRHLQDSVLDDYAEDAE